MSDGLDLLTPGQRGYAIRWLERYSRDQPGSTPRELLFAFGAYMWNEGAAHSGQKLPVDQDELLQRRLDKHARKAI